MDTTCRLTTFDVACMYLLCIKKKTTKVDLVDGTLATVNAPKPLNNTRIVENIQSATLRPRIMERICMMEGIYGSASDRESSTRHLHDGWYMWPHSDRESSTRHLHRYDTDFGRAIVRTVCVVDDIRGQFEREGLGRHFHLGGYIMRLVGLKILEDLSVMGGTYVITLVPNTLEDVSTIPPSRGSKH